LIKLSEIQQEFARCVSKLIRWANANGYEVTFGEAYRDPEWAKIMSDRGKGIVNSQHCRRLAIDLNLFLRGAFLLDSESHRPLGEYWTTLHPLARWGGDFLRRDGNHYSFEYEGVK